MKPFFAYLRVNDSSGKGLLDIFMLSYGVGGTMSDS